MPRLCLLFYTFSFPLVAFPRQKILQPKIIRRRDIESNARCSKKKRRKLYGLTERDKKRERKMFVVCRCFQPHIFASKWPSVIIRGATVIVQEDEMHICTHARKKRKLHAMFCIHQFFSLSRSSPADTYFILKNSDDENSSRSCKILCKKYKTDNTLFLFLPYLSVTSNYHRQINVPKIPGLYNF